MRPLLFLLILAGCDLYPTGPRLDQTAPSGAPGQIQAMVLCWADSATAQSSGFPWCGK